jgi:uncharacterized protein (TIGR00369 family)
LGSNRAATPRAGLVGAADTTLSAGLRYGSAYDRLVSRCWRLTMIKTVLDDFPTPPSAKLLGWRLLDARPWDGWLKVAFDGKAEFCNPAGFIQGGILTAMLDDSMGPAVFVTSEGRFYTTTISLTVNFIAPARPGPLTAEAQVIQIGKSIAFMEGKLIAGDGTVLATASTTARLIETAKALRQDVFLERSVASR